MSNEQQTEAIDAVWFLYSEDEQPMGILYRTEGEPEPQAGLRFKQDNDGPDLELLEFRELGPTCLMRRFRVVVRTVA